MNKKVLSALLAMLLTLALCGCAAAPEGEPSTAPAAGDVRFPVTVTDAAGRSVTLEREPETLVSGYYIATSMLVALGQGDKLVGIEAKADTRPIYRLAAPGLLELPSVGTAKEFNLEACAALKPDLVILPLALQGSIPALEALGLKVMTVKPESLGLLRETIGLLGAATGATEAAARLLAYSVETEDFLASTLADAPRPAVYLAGNSSYLSTAGGGMYQNTLMEMGGGANVAAGLEDNYWTEISYEQLLAWDPQVIVIAPSAKYTRDDLLADKQLGGLRAVQSGQIFAMPAGLEAWDSPVPSAAVGSRWMASVLHPERYGFEAFSADATEFYQSFYGITVDSALLAQ